MELVYFTAGDGLRDAEVREQCVRIPEVTVALAAEQKNREWDLLASLTIPEEFRRRDDAEVATLVRAVQAGLFERFLHADGGRAGPAREIILRTQFASTAAMLNEFRWRLRTGTPLVVHVIGPGLDELPRLLANRPVTFVDVIDHDPRLAWFWPKLKRAANA